jgi:hypothetical protein
VYPSSARLVPDDQSDERAFFARDLDEERNLSKQTVKRGHRHDAMRRPSLGTRILKSLARFFAAVLIGIGLTLAWQSYGEQAKQFTTTLAPSLAWLLPAENAKTTPEVTISSDLMQQMKLIAVDVAIVQRNLGLLVAGQEQFAAKQDQMSRNITSLQEVEQETRAQALTPPAARMIRPSPPTRIAPQVPSR